MTAVPPSWTKRCFRVLAGDVTYTVDGPTLTLKNADAYGLVLEMPTP